MFRNIVLFTLLCLMVLSSYLLTPLFFPDIPIERLWGGIKNPGLRSIYIVSIGVTTLCVLFLLWFSLRYTSFELLLSLGLFLLLSALWMPTIFLALSHSNPPGIVYYLSFIGLGLVAFFAYCMFQVIFRSDVPDIQWGLAVGASGIVFLHTFLLDFLLYPLMLTSV